MEAESGLDVAWCLTCSKRTVGHDPLVKVVADIQPDASSTYCSDACRQADYQPTPSSSKIPFTSPVPPAMYPTPSQRNLDRRRSSASPTKASAPRPVFATRAVTAVTPASEAAFSPPKVRTGVPRDRRAFSFPSAPNSPPTLFPLREHRGSTTLPPFSRPLIVAAQSDSLLPVKEDGLRVQDILSRRLAVSTGGANTPGTGAESVFLSTSDSEGEEEVMSRRKAPARTAASALPTALRAVSGTPHYSTLRSQLSLGRTNSLQPRSSSGSPVAAMIALSASSRSREDIISWARAIDRRNMDDDSEEDMERGRPRAKRLSSLARLPPPSTERLDEEDEVENDTGVLGTTPKGRIGSALAGLSGYGMGSIVKALTSVTASPSKPAATRKPTTPGRPGSNMADYAVAPSPATVAKVAVVASTMPLEDIVHSSQYLPGGPSTLSTASVSEAIEPSVSGTHDLVEIVTDDGGMSATSSAFNLRKKRATSRKDSVASVPPPVPERQQRPTGITSTIWSLSSYLYRFSPFASPPLPPTPVRPTHLSQQASSQSTALTISTPDTATPVGDRTTAPLPAVRSRPDTPDASAQELVRSVPMDIAISSQFAAFDMAREHHFKERLRSSRSRVRSRSRRRSRSRSSSAGRILDQHTPSMDPSYLSKGVGMTNQDPDADADVSDEEGGEATRGRDRARERGRRDSGPGAERGRGRGRDRSVKAT